MTYKVIQFLTIKELEKEVNKLIAEGWKPCGGVVVLNESGLIQFIQAMMK